MSVCVAALPLAGLTPAGWGVGAICATGIYRCPAIVTVAARARGPGFAVIWKLTTSRLPGSRCAGGERQPGVARGSDPDASWLQVVTVMEFADAVALRFKLDGVSEKLHPGADGKGTSSTF